MWKRVGKKPSFNNVCDVDDDARVHEAARILEAARIPEAARSHHNHRSHHTPVRRLDWDCHLGNCLTVCREGLREIVTR